MKDWVEVYTTESSSNDSSIPYVVAFDSGTVGAVLHEITCVKLVMVSASV